MPVKTMKRDGVKYCAECGRPLMTVKAHTCQPKHVIHALNPTAEDGRTTLCGDRKNMWTHYQPNEDVLEPYMRGCLNCIGVFEAAGGKSVWSRT